MYVEFLGIPRERAGISQVEVDAATLGELLSILVSRFPSLSELVPDGALHRSVAASLNGDEFVCHPETPLTDDDHVMILSADVGG